VASCGTPAAVGDVVRLRDLLSGGVLSRLARVVGRKLVAQNADYEASIRAPDEDVARR
jgi:hypothetical protein